MHAGPFLVGAVNQRWRQFRKALKRCRQKCAEKSVHDLRIAIRRLLSLLELVGGVLGEKAVQEISRRLKKHLDLLSPLRDAQVRLLHLEKLAGQFPELVPLLKAARKEEGNLLRRIRRKVKTIKTGRFKRFVTKAGKEIQKKLQSPGAERREDQALHKAVAAAFGPVAVRWQRFDAADPATLHRGRVAFKKFRYLVEALQPLLPGVGARELRQMHEFQRRMGEIQDLEVLSQWLKEYGAGKKAGASSSTARVQQELARRHQRKIALFLKASDQVYQFASQVGLGQTMGMDSQKR